MYTICDNANHGECVYNLIKRPQCGSAKPPMHKSRYSCMVRRENQCKKTNCKTMGPPVVPLCPPEHYLKKHSRAPISIRPPAVPKVQLMPVPVQTEEEMQDVLINLNMNENGHYDVSCELPQGGQVCPPCNGSGDCAPPGYCGDPSLKRRVPRLCCSEKPAVPPTCCSKFNVIPRGCKDFVRDNTVSAIRQPAKIPSPRFVDEVKGTTHNWCKSGMARKYVCRHDYGMIPGYLAQRKLELQDKFNQEKYASEQAKRDAQEKCRHLNEQERQTLLCGLKTNWEQVFREYQSLPLKVDTPVKIKVKFELEEQLRSIEKDIQLLERHNHIFVGDANRSFYMA
ncbi:unnamed protein product [Allacma fusca]|uniref:Enkurin domain-containing protein n=1 Tax=Allacma fusca TaxID=39272 RepID=A0A8J2LLK3_9HEXA|nr:unnamed protein product [Allacma fusca]